MAGGCALDYRGSFTDGVGVFGIILAVVCLVLDKAGKLKGGWLVGLLLLACVMTLFLGIGNSWVLDAPAKWKLWRGVLMLCLVTLTYSGLAIWIKPAKESQMENESSKFSTGKCALIAQQSTPDIHPSPDEASDQQLLRASLAVRVSVGNLKTVDLNAQIKAKH